MTDADVCGAYLMLDRNEDELHEVPEVTMKELYGFFLIQIIATGGLQIFGLICRILQSKDTRAMSTRWPWYRITILGRKPQAYEKHDTLQTLKRRWTSPTWTNDIHLPGNSGSMQSCSKFQNWYDVKEMNLL